MDRTVLAAERTYAAWVRTGIASLVCGAGTHRLLTGAMPLRLIQLIAAVFIVAGMCCFIAGMWREGIAATMSSGADVGRVPRVIPYIANAALLVVSTLVLIGIWIHL